MAFKAILVVSWWSSVHVYAFNSHCNQTLGLETGHVADDAITASSSYDSYSTGPQHARLNHDKLGGAWCPKETIQQGVKEWIQIQFTQTHVITGIVTQGRYGKGTGQEYLKHFMIEYKGGPGTYSQWKLYSDKDSHTVFNGSQDTITPVYQSFNPPIITKTIRVVPFSHHPRVVCLRLELHGCLDSSGIIAYSSPVPDLLGVSNITSEQIFWEKQSHGLLTDGAFGLRDIRINKILSYEDGWMSWKRKSNNKPIELIFKFDSPRKFNKVNIFTANLIHLGIQVFEASKVWFSIGGEYYVNEPVNYVYMADTILKEPRNVSIRLNEQIGQFVKIQLYFANIWISISEVTFDCETTDGPFYPEQTPFEISNTDLPQIETETSTETTLSQGMGMSSSSSQPVEIEVLIGVLTAVTLILLFLFLVVLVYSKRRKFLQSPTSRRAVLNPFPVQINMKELLTASPILSGGETTNSQHSPNPMTMAVTAPGPPPEYEHMMTTSNNMLVDHQQQQQHHQRATFEECRSKWHSTGHVPTLTTTGFRTSLPVAASVSSVTAHSHCAAVVSSANIIQNPLCSEYASVDIQNIGHYRTLQPPSAPMTTAAPSNIAIPSTYNLGHYFPRVSSEPPSRKTYQTSTRNGDPLKPLPMAETLWNLTTTVQALCKQPPSSLAEIPRNKLRLKESFGRGCLGEVLLCEVDSDYSNLPQSIAVRSGPSHLNDSMDRKEFLRECRLLASLTHTNIVTLLGVAMSEEPYCTLLEHSSHGDLYHYLRQMNKIQSDLTNSNDSTSSGCSSGSPMMNPSCSKNINYARIVDMAAQIATGMKYLETRNIVHKDLAARNCLLCDNNVVKITDVAMGISLFNSDYSEVRGRSCAPIRWQPWETLLLGRLSTQSNVWSFGITFWELLTLCRQRPFALLTDIEVLQNAEHAYYNEGLQVQLSQPEHCERDIWDLLEECWNRDEDCRPTFSEISMFLKRKTLTTHNTSDVKLEK